MSKKEEIGQLKHMDMEASTGFKIVGFKVHPARQKFLYHPPVKITVMGVNRTSVVDYQCVETCFREFASES